AGEFCLRVGPCDPATTGKNTSATGDRRLLSKCRRCLRGSEGDFLSRPEWSSLCRRSPPSATARPSASLPPAQDAPGTKTGRRFPRKASTRQARRITAAKNESPRIVCRELVPPRAKEPVAAFLD